MAAFYLVSRLGDPPSQTVLLRPLGLFPRSCLDHAWGQADANPQHPDDLLNPYLGIQLDLLLGSEDCLA